MQIIADRYELIEVIASGGMATVWRARDRRLNRMVAVKRPLPSRGGDSADRRMKREARAAAGLAHPNLVTIYDYGEDEDGPFLVMELLHGPTLLETSDEIGASEAIDAGAQLADGLAAIHQAGIVHRDVKPANVVMSDHGPQLTDFGIATQPGLAGDITDPGLVVATPAYAAPEVLRGDEPTAASDVYSLSIMIDELVSQSESPVDPELQRVLASGRSVVPDERPSAREFAAALRAVTPTVVRPVVRGGSTLVLEAATSEQSDGEPAGGSTRRSPLWVYGLLSVAAIGVLALVVALAGEEPNAEALLDQPIASGSTTSTTSRSTSTTTQADSTAPYGANEIQSLMSELEALLLEPPRSDLNTSEVDDVMKKIVESVELAREGKTKDAEKKLSEAAKRIDKKLGDEPAEEALRLLSEIAGLLGIELETDAGENEV